MRGLRFDKIVGFFCRILSLLWGSFAKETCSLIDPTKQSHSMCLMTTADTGEAGLLDEEESDSDTSLLQNVVCFIGLFCKRDLKF